MVFGTVLLIIFLMFNYFIKTAAMQTLPTVATISQWQVLAAKVSVTRSPSCGTLS